MTQVPFTTSARPADEAVDAPPRRVGCWGGLGAVALFAGIALFFALGEPPFSPPDESAHLGYVHELADGDLPRIDAAADVPASAVEWRAELASAPDDRYRDVWVANHPPLFYAAAVPAIWLSELTDRADGGLLFLRWVNIAFAAAGVWFTYLLGRDVSGGSTRLGVAAAAIVALVPQAHAILAEGLNDGLGFAAGTFVTWAALRCIAPGPARRDQWVFAAAVVVAVGARLATALVALVLVAFVALAQLGGRDVPWRARAGRAVGIAAAGVVPALVLFGWFYARNAVLYGDVSGSSFLLERFGRRPNGSLVEVLGWGHLWIDLYHKLLSPSPLFRVAAPIGADAAGLVALAGVAAVLVTGTVGEQSGSRQPMRVARSGLVLCAVVVLVVMVTVAQHVSGGGNPHGRYLFPALGAMAALVTVGLNRLLPRVLPVAVVVLLALWAAINVPRGVDPHAIERPRDHGASMPALLQRVPSTPLLQASAAALVVAGVVGVVVGLAGEALRRRSTVPPAADASAPAPVLDPSAPSPR